MERQRQRQTERETQRERERRKERERELMYIYSTLNFPTLHVVCVEFATCIHEHVTCTKLVCTSSSIAASASVSFIALVS